MEINTHKYMTNLAITKLFKYIPNIFAQVNLKNFYLY